MVNLFALLFLISVLALIIGIFSPRTSLFWLTSDKQTRPMVLFIYMGLIIISTFATGIIEKDKIKAIESTTAHGQKLESPEKAANMHNPQKTQNEQTITKSMPSTTTSSQAIVATPEKLPAAPEEVQISEQQKKFIRIIHHYATLYNEADNELKKSKLVKERGRALNGLTRANGWIGTVYSMGTNTEGKAYISIKIDDIIYFSTNNNTFLGDDGTMVNQTSPLYDIISNLKKGNKIKFSCAILRKINITENGFMNEPEFLVKFTKIEAIEP